MEQLEAARDELLDENDEVVGLAKDVKEVEKHLRHRATGCYRATHGGWCLSLSFSCLPPRTNCTNGMYFV